MDVLSVPAWPGVDLIEIRVLLRNIRMIFVFAPWSQAVLLVAGNKAGDWSRWYKTAIPAAEVAYDGWLAFERKRREGS